MCFPSLDILFQDSSVKAVYSVWEGLGAETTPPINLLIGCEQSGCGQLKDDVLQWCVKKGVELIPWEIESQLTVRDEEDKDNGNML